MPFMILPTILAASVSSVLMRRLALRGRCDLFTFNFVSSLLWLVILGVLCLFFSRAPFSPREILFGVLYGAVGMLFLVFKSGAMSSGPVSVTTLIGNCSLLLSTAVSVTVLHESMTGPDGIGIAVLLFAVALCTFRRPDGEKAEKRWLPFCVGFFVFASGVGIVFKLFSGGGEGDVNRMMFVASAVMTVSSFLLSLATGSFRRQTVLARRANLVPVLLAGALGCFYNRLNITLAGRLDGVFFFPAFNGGVVLLSTLLGILVLRERMTRRRALGLSVGVLAVLIIGIF